MDRAPGRVRRLLALAVAVLLVAGVCEQIRVPPAGFSGTAYVLDRETRELMTGRSWRPGCPVRLDDLRLVVVTHWGFDGQPRQGELVVHRDWAGPVIDAFRQLYDARFPIERMRLVDHYGADDDASMAANNTSAFNCRPITGGTAWSRHSYGVAIDINPVQNPYVSGGTVLPPAGAPYATVRDPAVTGLIVAGGPVTRAFGEIGWEWGGTWTRPRDHQHVEAPGGPPPAIGTGRVRAAPAMVPNADGRLEVFAVDAGRTLIHAWHTCGGCGWSGFVPVTGGGVPVGPVEGTVAAARNRDGRLEVFGVDPAGRPVHTWQTCAGCGWSALAPMPALTGAGAAPAPRAGGAAATTRPDGRIVVAVLGARGGTWLVEQGAGGGWGPWRGIGGPDLVGAPALGVNHDGRLEAFATGRDGWLWHAWEHSPGGAWSGWAPFAPGAAGSPSVTENHDGRLEVAALGPDRILRHSWQWQAGVDWSGFVPYDGPQWRGDPALTRTGDGRLEIFVEGDDRAIHHAWQWEPGGTWSPWHPLGGTLP